MDQKQAIYEERTPHFVCRLRAGEQHLENGVQRWPEGPAGHRDGEGSGASPACPSESPNPFWHG